MEETRACLLSYAFDGEGSGRLLDLATIADDDQRFIWIHLNGRHADAKKFIKDQLKLDPLLQKTLLAEEMRPRLEERGPNTLILLRGINFHPGPTPEDLVSIRLWVSGNRIISVSRRKSRAVAELDERIKQGRGPRRVGEFIAMLCSHLNDGLEPAIVDLDETVDRLEEISLESPDSDLRNDIAAIRKQATLFKRHMAPQRDVYSRLYISQLSWLTTADKWYMQDNNDRMTRFLEDLDALRERSQILQDELTSALSAKLNKNLYILSIVTALFMPLSFFSGLLGMNLSGIPGAQHPMSFGIACGIAMMIALVEIMIFKKLKWF